MHEALLLFAIYAACCADNARCPPIILHSMMDDAGCALRRFIQLVTYRSSKCNTFPGTLSFNIRREGGQCIFRCSSSSSCHVRGKNAGLHSWREGTIPASVDWCDSCDMRQTFHCFWLRVTASVKCIVTTSYNTCMCCARVRVTAGAV